MKNEIQNLKQENNTLKSSLENVTKENKSLSKIKEEITNNYNILLNESDEIKNTLLKYEEEFTNCQKMATTTEALETFHSPSLSVASVWAAVCSVAITA